MGLVWHCLVWVMPEEACIFTPLCYVNSVVFLCQISITVFTYSHVMIVLNNEIILFNKESS